MTAIAPDATPSPEDHAYFLTIERSFLALRRKAALLTAADWQEAQAWHRQGIPVELIQDVMEKLFERQRARKGRSISGLRYFRAAVESAWEEMLALKAGGRAEEAAPLPVSSRLANLANSLPAKLPRRDRWTAEVLGLGALVASGSTASEVEAALRAVDAAFLQELRAGLDPNGRAALETELDRAMARLRGRLSQEDIETAAARLAEQLLRRHFDAPVLSLFSPEAREGGDPPDSGG